MSDRTGRTGGAWGRVRDWFDGGDPQGMTKLRYWARGYDDRPEGYTYGMMGPAMVLSVIAIVVYPLTRGYGSVVALALAVVLLVVRQTIERRVARDVADITQAREHYDRTRNPEYLDFARLSAEGLVEGNRMLTPTTRAWLGEQAEQARDLRERHDRRVGRKSSRRSSGGRKGHQGQNRQGQGKGA